MFHQTQEWTDEKSVVKGQGRCDLTPRGVNDPRPAAGACVLQRLWGNMLMIKLWLSRIWRQHPKVFTAAVRPQHEPSLFLSNHVYSSEFTCETWRTPLVQTRARLTTSDLHSFIVKYVKSPLWIKTVWTQASLFRSFSHDHRSGVNSSLAELSVIGCAVQVVCTLCNWGALGFVPTSTT